MTKFCKNCKHVRTAEELGVVSPATKADELFCGNYPPVTREYSVQRPDWDGLPDTQWIRGTDEPVCLPPRNDGQGYRNMSCWTARNQNKYATMSYNIKEIESLYTLMSTASVEWKLHNAEIYTRCKEALVELRSRP